MKDGESPYQASYTGCNHAKQELQRKRNLQATTHGSEKRMFFSEFEKRNGSLAAAFRTPISSIGCNHHNNNSNCLQEKIRMTTQIKSQVSQCKLQIYINATGDVFLGGRTVYQIMTELFCDRKEKLLS
jgi:biotin synthase-related radical SAM superfamily protein